MRILEKLKLYLEITDTSKDALLNSMIEDAQQYVRVFCGFSEDSEIPPLLNNTIVKMVVFDYNKRGSEGLNSESYAGASYSYVTEYPQEIRSALYRERLAVVS